MQGISVLHGVCVTSAVVLDVLEIDIVVVVADAEMVSAGGRVGDGGGLVSEERVDERASVDGVEHGGRSDAKSLRVGVDARNRVGRDRATDLAQDGDCPAGARDVDSVGRRDLRAREDVRVAIISRSAIRARKTPRASVFSLPTAKRKRGAECAPARRRGASARAASPWPKAARRLLRRHRRFPRLPPPPSSAESRAAPTPALDLVNIGRAREVSEGEHARCVGRPTRSDVARVLVSAALLRIDGHFLSFEPREEPLIPPSFSFSSFVFSFVFSLFFFSCRGARGCAGPAVVSDGELHVGVARQLAEVSGQAPNERRA